MSLVQMGARRAAGILTEKQRQRAIERDGHLLWTGGLANGYPAVKQGIRTAYVKRVVPEEVHVALPSGAVIISTAEFVPASRRTTWG